MVAEANAHGQPWDNAADGWNAYGELIHDWLREATAAMLDAAHIDSGARVLDIAAGAGDQTLDIARRVGAKGYVLATDISAQILAHARRNARAADLQQVNTRVADAQHLGLSGADFDAAVCRLGLMFCRSPSSALREIYSALRRGGRFSALVFSSPQQNPCIEIMMSTARKHAGLSAKSPREPGALLSLGAPGLLEQLLPAAGFADVNVRPISAPMRLRSCRQYIDFVRHSGSPIMEILASLAASAQNDAWSDIEDQLNVFNTPSGWEGPNELLLCAAAVP
jgi:SAM-dependent methyltransferase